MMAISTGGIGPVDMTSASKQKSKTKDETRAVDAFSSLMNMTAVQQNNPQMENTDGIEASEIGGSMEYGDRYEADINDNYKKETVSDKYDSTDTKKTDDDSTMVNSDDITGGAEKLIQGIKDIVTETLGITEDELENMLSELGISIEDLLDGSIMKDFILKSQNATEVDILINEGLADMISGVSDKLNELLKQYGISDISEFQERLAEILAQSVDSSESSADNVSETATDETDIIAESKTYSSETGESLTETDIKIDISADARTQSENENTQFGDARSGYGDNYSQVAANLNQAIEGLASSEPLSGTSFEDGIDQADIIRQIIDNIKVNITKDVTSMELRLNPEHLGRVQISVASKNGIMQAQIVAETEAAKRAIENSIATLKETFNSQELKVEAVEVMVATYEFFNQGENGGFEHDGQSRTSGKNSAINLGDSSSDGELSEEEQLEVELMKAKGSSVSYSI